MSLLGRLIRMCTVKLFIIAATTLITLGFLNLYLLPPMIARYIHSQIELRPGSLSYPLWRDLPVPIYQKFYLFNITNANEVEQFGHTPNLQEIGPFTYSSKWTKKKIVDNRDINGTISFKEYKTWHFERELSVADHRIMVTTLNAPLAITLTLIQSASNAVRLIVTLSLDGLSEGFFIKRSVKQMLFDGYPDLLTTFGPLLNAEMLSQGGKFGYMNARNNSEDGAYEIHSGKGDIYKLNTMTKYNGKPALTYWNGTECNSFEGASNGELFPPLRPNQQSIHLFHPDFCRVWRMDSAAAHDQQHKSGLLTKRFVASTDILRNSTNYPPNSCYYNSDRLHNPPVQPQPGAHHSSSSNTLQAGHNRNNGTSNSILNNQNRVRYEWPSGVYTIAPCKFNAPLFISMPHFLHADPYYLATVTGLKPNRSEHEFYLDVEPTTGTPVQLAARVQLNVAINKPPGLVRFRNVPEIVFPIFWQELSVNLTDGVIEHLLMASTKPDEVTAIISYSLFYMGASSLIITCALFIYFRHSDSEELASRATDDGTTGSMTYTESSTTNISTISSLSS